MATSSGPCWNHTSRWASRSVATAVNGSGRSSIVTSPISCRTCARIRSARIAPGEENETSIDWALGLTQLDVLRLV
jgi:hypothetical protein